MDLRLKGKRALVTGSTAGIGEEAAKSLAREGASVIIQGRREKEAQRVAQEIGQRGGKAEIFIGDLSTDAGAEGLSRYKDIDIVINNAGAYFQDSWDTPDPQQWLDIYNNNVASMIRVIKHLLPPMKQRKWGRFIQLASCVAFNPKATMAAYSSTKSANANLTVSLAQALAGTGITANSVSPGPILTPTLEEKIRAMGKEKGWGTDPKELECHFVNDFLPNSIGRMGRPEEVGDLIAYLASPLTDFISGANFRIDGDTSHTIN